MARLQSGGLVLLFMTATTLVQAATLFKDKSYMHQVPRQLGVGQGASTSTFNYWWPYPAWTATAATSPAAATAGMATTTALLPTPTTLNPTFTLQDGVLASLSVPSSDSSSIPTFSGTLTTLSDTSSPAPPSSSSSAPASASSSPTAPHSNSSFPSRSFFTSSHFLIPLIAAVSTTVVLSLLLWLICRHRRHARTSSSSFSTQGKGGWRVVEESQRRRGWWSGLFRGRGDEFEETVPGPKYVGVEEDPEGPRCVEEDARRLLGEDGGEQGGRLDIASWAAQAGGSPVPKRKRSGTRLSRGSRHSRKRGGSMSVGRPLLSSSAFAPAPAAGFLNDLSDEEGDDGFEDDDEDKPEMRVPWESLRHKSIKRAILAKVDEEKRWTDSMRGVRAARAVQAVGGAEETSASPSRSRSASRKEGFRIVVESPPLRIPTPGSNASGRSPPWSLASAFPFPLFSSGDHQRAGEEEDKYTPIPSQSRSRARPAYRPSPSVLRMRSPPSVMTPQMESALCFTPVVGASARMEDENDNAEKTGTVYTETYRDRADRAIKRVEAIVESARSDRGRG